MESCKITYIEVSVPHSYLSSWDREPTVLLDHIIAPDSAKPLVR